MAQIARITTWASAQILTSSALNGEFNNIITAWNNTDTGSTAWTALSVSGASTLTGAVTIKPTTNQLILGTTRTVTINAVQPASTSRIYTVPDAAGNANFILSSGTNTFSSVVTFPAGTVSACALQFTGSNAGTGIFTNTADSLYLALAGSSKFLIDSAQTITRNAIWFPDGASTTPSISFENFNTTGWFAATGPLLLASLGGTQHFRISSTSIDPSDDNAKTCGASGRRYTAVWSVNGTIQTSVSSTKTEIRTMTDDQITIPTLAKFQRPGLPHDQIGFIADDLPPECFAVIDNETGERSKEDVYTSSVIGLLCGKVSQLENRISQLEQPVQ